MTRAVFARALGEELSMGKLKDLKDRMTHKEGQPDVSNEADEAFLHKTSRDLGVTQPDKSTENHGIKPVY
jgi:hypothetical protein